MVRMQQLEHLLCAYVGMALVAAVFGHLARANGG